MDRCEIDSINVSGYYLPKLSKAPMNRIIKLLDEIAPFGWYGIPQLAFFAMTAVSSAWGLCGSECWPTVTSRSRFWTGQILKKKKKTNLTGKLSVTSWKDYTYENLIIFEAPSSPFAIFL